MLRGVREAKDLSEYDNLASAAYLRAKEDYLMGINFSRVLTLKYGWTLGNFMKQKRSVVVAVGRVMTCVLGMIVKREREIRSFVPIPFYKVLSHITPQGVKIESEWKAVKGSRYFESKKLYKDNGFLKKEDAEAFIKEIEEASGMETIVEASSKRQEKKNPPLLYNLAELQNQCSKMFKLSPDETLKIVQELYEKKLVTYPRTDAGRSPDGPYGNLWPHGWHYPPERPQRPAGRTQRCLLRQLVRLSSGICSDGLKRQILRR